MFRYEKEIDKETDTELDLFYRVWFGAEEIGSFIISKRLESFGEYIVLESFEINTDYRKNGYSKIILIQIQKVIKELKTKKTMFLFLEPIPFRSGLLKSNDLIRIYERGLKVKYITNHRIMIKSFKKELSEESCLSLINDYQII